MRYPFVLLDAGETLFGPRVSFGAVYARILAPMGIDRPPAAFEGAIRSVWRELADAVPAGLDRYSFFDGGEEGYWLRFAAGAIERAAGDPLPAGLVERALPLLREAFLEREAWEVFPDTIPSMDRLRREGARLCVVSNWDSRLPYLLKILGLEPYLDAVAVSHFVGHEKPAPEIFHRALAMLGAREDESVHVGDLPEVDLAGARAAGIDALLVDRRGRLEPSLGALPDLAHVVPLVCG